MLNNFLTFPWHENGYKHFALLLVATWQQSARNFLNLFKKPVFPVWQLMSVTYNQPIRVGCCDSLTVIGAFTVVRSNKEFENSIVMGGKLGLRIGPLH